MYNERNPLISKHKITLAKLIYRYNQSIEMFYDTNNMIMMPFLYSVC